MSNKKKKPKSFSQKIGMGVIFTFVGILFSVFILNIFLKIPAPCSLLRAEWQPGDALSFWGSILGGGIGAVVTIIGVYFTLKQSSKDTQAQIEITLRTTNETLKQNQEFALASKKANVLPIITITKVLSEIHNYNFLMSAICKMIETQKAQEKNENIPVEDKSEYVEFKLSELAIVFSSNGNINIFPHLSAEQLNKIKDPFQTTVTSTTASMGEKKLLYVPFYFTNGGIGTAVNFSLQIFENEKFIVASQPLSLAPSEEVKVSFYSDDYHWVAPKYEIRLVYSDIYKTKYTQRHSISFDNKEKAFALSAEVDQSEIDA